MILQHLVHAGRPHGPEDACQDVHCASCGRDGPRRWARVCGECFHAWRWGWLLSLHDMLLWWQMDKRLHIRRSSKIVGCPCCSHDL